jgi:chromosome segregation ATPase
MAKPTALQGAQRKEAKSDRGSTAGRQENAKGQAVPAEETPVPPGLDVWSTDDALRQELERITTESRRLLDGGGGEKLPPAGPAEPSEELARSRAENEEMRNLIAELQKRLEATSSVGEQAWAERQKGYEELLEQKSELIREQHLRIQELEQNPQQTGTAISEDDLHAMAEELERERHDIEEARRQLEEDEKSMVQQMREMELGMSRERAELARQRNELQRLHSDIRHELERAKKEDSLGDRLRQLQRRHSEVSGRKGGQEAAPPPAQTPQPPQPAAAPPPKPRDSGLFRRLFGQGG